ncbi:MAG: GatB/YqeY domain-containing protein [Proteobacteria bacterium]|nr:GatB/YqeY domain-containing protein [Pseudomonadota bacterium]
MQSLKERMQEDMKSFMRAKNQTSLNALRLILAAVKQFEVDNRIPVDDQQMLVILDKLAKQRRESITQFEQANRQDLIEKERFELDLIQSYLPAQLSEAEITQLIKDAIQSTQATSVKDMGKVMATIKPQTQGRADMSYVSGKIKELLCLTN